MDAPPPLIGRDRELQALGSALVGSDGGIVVLRGPAGSGKTRLTLAALEQLRRSGVLVGIGKYGEGSAQSPLGPILTAFSELTDQALEQLYDPQAGLTQLMENLKVELEVLIRAGFRGGGTQTRLSLSTLSGRREDLARLTVAASKLLHWLGGFGLPLVVVLDDWWRATDEPRQLMTALARESFEPPLTQLLLERVGHETGRAEEDAGRRIHRLGPLSPSAGQALLNICLSDAGAAQAVTGWFGEAAPRQPFEIIQTARALQDSGALERSADGLWRIDDAAAATVGRPELTLGIGRRIGGLPEDARRLALGAALWGDEAPVEGLAIALAVTVEQVAPLGQTLVAAGLVVEVPAGLRFGHDRLREEVLRQAADEEVRALAAAMAERLARTTPDAAARWSRVALNLRQKAGLDGADPAFWRPRFAAGALAARSSADRDAAVVFAETAWALRERGGEPDPARDRLLLHEAVLAAADRGDADAVADRSKLLIARALEDGRLGEAYTTAALASWMTSDHERAWSVMVEGLGRFGVRVPATFGKTTLIAAALRWKLTRFRRRRQDSARAEGLTELGEAAATLAFERSPAHAALIGLMTSVRAGHSRRGAAFWASVDAFLSSSMGDYAAAAKLGEAALAAMRPTDPGRGGILYRALYFGVIWRRPAGELRRRCDEIHDIGVADGDLAVAGNALRNALTLEWRSGAPLEQVILTGEESLRGLARLGESPESDRVCSVRELVEFARALSGPRSRLEAPGSFARPTVLLNLQRATLLGNWPAAARLADALLSRRAEFDNHPGGVDWRFHETLARLKAGERPPARDLAFLRLHAKLNPIDHGAKLAVVRAEALALRGRGKACLEAYERAVAAAESAPSRLEAGLAATCAAQAAERFGTGELAVAYRERADRIWIAWGAQSLVSAASSAAGQEAAAVDSTLSDRLEEAEAHATAAERADRAKSRFLATVAHELRTPMQGLQSLLDLASTDGGALDIDQFRDVFASLTTVVDDLADLGALSGGGMPLKLGPVALRALLESETALAAALSPDGPPPILAYDETAPAAIETDPSRLRQLVRNLLANGIKHGAGSPVVVRLSRLPGPSPERVALELRVEDSGPGVPPAALARIFEPFERAGGPDRPDGFGLGLSVARQVAESLGGRLWAENRPEGGAAFCFTFDAAPTALPEAASVEGSPPPVLKVLLAEDVALTRTLITSLLERDGHAVRAVSNGLEALQALERERFDLCLLDMSMPKVDGAGVLAELKRRGDRTPVVVISAATGPEHPRGDGRDGPMASLRKPVTLASLREVLACIAGAPQPSNAPSPQPIDQALATQADDEMRRLAREIVLLGATGTESDRRTLAEAAHRLAGLALQFGRVELGGAADRLEAAARSGDPAWALVLGDLERSAGLQLELAAHAGPRPLHS